jgi:hypothetical protein
VSSTVADEHDASEPLDRDPSVAYRFGALSDLTGGLHLSGLKTETYLASGEAVWAGPFGILLKTAWFSSVLVRFVLIIFPPFELFQI